MQVVSSSVHKAVCGKTVQALLDDLPHADPASVSGLPAGVFRGGFSGLLSDAGPAATVAPPLPGLIKPTLTEDVHARSSPRKTGCDRLHPTAERMRWTRRRRKLKAARRKDR